MSASGFTPIQLYRTSTAAAAPTAGNLADGELAINLTDEKLYFKNASGVVKLLASNSGSLGSVTSVNASGSTTGLTFTGGPITSSGTLTLGGTLVVGNGGTGSGTAAGARTNLGVPANDGTGATGTWGISVTGTAANVTGTVAVANGGTGATSLTSGYVLKGNGTSAVSASVIYDNGTNVGIGLTSPGATLDVNGTILGRSTLSVNDAINYTGSSVFYIRSRLNGGTVQIGTETPAGTLYYPITINGTSDFTSFSSSSGEAMRITSAGNVGIGTNAPGALLHLSGSVPRLQFTDTDTGANSRINADSSSGALQIEADFNNTVANSGINFSVDGSTRMSVTSIGNVGIGTTSPQARLHVCPTTDVNMRITNVGTMLRTIAINDGGSAYIDWRRDANQHTFETSGAERVRIDSIGNVGIGTTAPAQRIHAATTAAPTGTTQSFLRLTGDATYGADFGGGIIQGTGPIATISTVNAGTATERMRIGTNGNVGINETAPDYKLDVNGTFGFTPGSSVTPVDNGDVVFELTNNTTLTIKAKGSDGVVRSATITLA